MLTPLFKGAGMPYLGAVHGSDTNYIFNGVFPEVGDQCQEEDEKLAREMAGAFVRFAYTGDPSPTGDEDGGDGDKKGEGKKGKGEGEKKGKGGCGNEEGWEWPEAFGGPPLEDDEVMVKSLEELHGLNVHVIGGPVGTGSCKVRHHRFVDAEHENLGSMQKPIVGGDGVGVEYGEMGAKPDEDEEKAKQTPEQIRRKREALLEREKLLKRCAFIGTLNEKLGV